MRTITITSVAVGFAQQTLTSNNTNVSNADTVTIGNKVYTFKTTLTATEGEVLIGATADASLLNLIRAINHTGTPDFDYSCAVAHTQVYADAAVASHAFTVYAFASGTGPNSYATTETAATLSWGNTTLLGGVALSIAGTVADQAFNPPNQQVTIGEYPTLNKEWSRNQRLTDQAAFCLRAGARGVALLQSSWSKLAVAVETSLTWPPKFYTQPSAASCVASSTAAVFTVVLATELAATYAWQYNASAVSTLTNDGSQPADASTVVVNGKTYTFQTVLTDVDGHVHIGASNTATMTNLWHAINASGGTPGTDYATSTTAHATVSATNPTGTTVKVTAKVAGTGGNAYGTTVGGTSHCSWTSTLMAGGGWTAAAGTVNACVYTNNTTASLTCTPTSNGTPNSATPGQSGVSHRCVATSAAGATTSDSAVLTIT